MQSAREESTSGKGKPCLCQLSLIRTPGKEATMLTQTKPMVRGPLLTDGRTASASEATELAVPAWS